MDIADLLTESARFRVRLESMKQELDLGDRDWYPYGSMDNFVHLDRLLTGERRDLLAYAGDHPVLDIGAADGDSAFFLESLGLDVHVLENPSTNFTGLRGLQTMHQALESQVAVTEVDLDTQFTVPEGRFGLTLMLGLLYHLKNPFYVLETLARSVEHMLLSTRVARYNVAEGLEDPGSAVNPRRVDIGGIPAAYLVDPAEANGDATNFWMFTPVGLRRILDRTGWDVVEFTCVGATEGSDPASSTFDERAFCLVRSRNTEG